MLSALIGVVLALGVGVAGHDAGVPPYWPVFRLAYDAMAAAYLAWLLVRATVEARPARRGTHMAFQKHACLISYWLRECRAGRCQARCIPLPACAAFAPGATPVDR